MGKGKRLRELRAASVETVYRTEGITERWFYIIRYIAMITMFIDHFGRVLYLTGQIDANLCIICYVIGRIAFPLFAFELVESFYFTKNRKKHLLRLGLLALVSELPFDMVATVPNPTEFSENVMLQQNVCFTLFFGFLMLMIAEKLAGRIFALLRKHRYIGRTLSATVRVILTVVFGIIVSFLMTDYSWYGIVLIALFAFARSLSAGVYTKFWQGAAMLWFAVTYGVSLIVFMPLSVSLALIYIAEIRSARVAENKPIGNTMKCFCRAFYPLHLALLGTLRALLMGWRLL